MMLSFVHHALIGLAGYVVGSVATIIAFCLALNSYDKKLGGNE